jgi:hypothetical protein
MRINEILVESALEEGPILNKIGSGIGKAAGTVAKGVGAVAGGVAGLGSALKKGFQAGKQTVAGAGDATTAAPAGTAPAAPANTAAPTPGFNSAAAADPAAATTAADINAQGPKGTAAAKTQTGAGAQAIQKTAQAAGGDAEKAGQTLYAQVKSQVNQLDKKGKSRIMQLLQKSLQQTPAANTAAPTDANVAAPGSDAAKDNLYGAGNRPKGAKDKVAALKAQNATTTAPANTMANTPVSATNTAAADNPNQPPPAKKRGGRVAGADLSQTPDAIRKRNARRDKKNAAATTGGAGAFNQMAQSAAQQNASKNNLGNPLAEALARQIKVHKQKMYEQVSATVASDSFSIFRKK